MAIVNIFTNEGIKLLQHLKFSKISLNGTNLKITKTYTQSNAPVWGLEFSN